MLVTMHDVGFTQRAQQTQADRVGPLAPDVPGFPSVTTRSGPTISSASVSPKVTSVVGHGFGHRPGQFERVAFRAAHDAGAAEERWHHVGDAHAYFTTSSS